MFSFFSQSLVVTRISRYTESPRVYLFVRAELMDSESSRLHARQTRGVGRVRETARGYHILNNAKIDESRQIFSFIMFASPIKAARRHTARKKDDATTSGKEQNASEARELAVVPIQTGREQQMPRRGIVGTGGTD